VNAPILLRKPRRFFTPDEANAALPDARDRVTTLGARLARAQELAEILERSATGREVTMSEIQAMKADVARLLEELAALGVDLKGVRPALLDFPALRDGQEVYLCWREGEADITHWHPLHTGIRGRQPLEGDTASWEWCS
jgi:hypothetical protein